MTNPSLAPTLTSLRQAADEAAALWPSLTWKRLSGPGPDYLQQDTNGAFIGLALEPGQDLTLSCRLVLPAEISGIALEGQTLEVTLFSLYATELSWNGVTVFAEDGVPVAAGPALVTLIPALRAGDNGELRLHVQVPPNQMTTWLHVRFTTPSLRARFELLDTAWAELALADALATKPEHRTCVEAAAASLPSDLAEFGSAALERMEAELAQLAPEAARLTVHVIGHSHIDMNWLWTWPDTANVIHRDFRNILALMDDYPELTFTHSQPATYDLIRREAPDLFARVVQRIAEGRWEPATLTWVEADENMASGEALAHHFLEAVTFSRKELGAEPTSLLAPDTFGHPGNLPQLAASAGALRYYHHRCNPGQGAIWPAYWWEGQDGTRLLAISTPSYNGDIRARDLVEAILRGYHLGHHAALHFHGVGDHGGGPARQNLDALRRFQKRPLLPCARCSTLAAYTQELLESGVALPVQHGESSTIFEGCYTTHADIKRYNRHGENSLCTAETLAALAGIDATEQLQPAWHSVLFNQFHDILDGSAIHETYEKCADDYAAVVAVAQDVTSTALQILEAGLAEGSIAVTNPLGWEREDWVVVSGRSGEGAVMLVSDSGHQTLGQYTHEGLGFLARVGAFGTVSYRIGEPTVTPACPDLTVEPAFAPMDPRSRGLVAQSAEEAPYLRIETPVFRVLVRRDCGILVSLYDKRVGRELVSYGTRRVADYMDSARPDLALNVIQLVEEHPHAMTAWHMDEVASEQSLIHGANTRVIENGPARIVLEVSHHVRSSRIVQHISFYRQLARIDFDTALDWQELGTPELGVPNLKVAFTARLMAPEAWFETPFAAIQRPADGQESPALRWADVGNQDYGIALLNESKYGYDALGPRLRLTLVRSGYDPDAISDVGTHHIRYSLVPHPGDWRSADIVRQAAGFNQPLIARHAAGAGTPPALTWRPQLEGAPSVMITALKQAQDGQGWILRLYESGGRAGEVTLRGLPENSRVWETNIIEDPLTERRSLDGALHLAFQPWQIRTLRIGGEGRVR